MSLARWSPRGWKRYGTIVACLLFGLLSTAACVQKMVEQPKYTPLESSQFFSDKRSARHLVPGTVARGRLHTDALLYTGTVDGQPAQQFPFPVTKEVLARGQERFNIYCAPCHSRTGDGNGMVVRRGFPQPPSFHTERLRQAPPGYFFSVISDGFGVMPSYASQVPVEDRWAIIAYVRALQLSRNATLDDVPSSARQQLESEPQ